MNVDTCVEVSTFGWVSQFGDTRLVNLRSRSAISISSRFLNPETPARSKRINKCVADILVRLFLTESSVTSVIYCGSKMGRGINIQTCVAPASSYLVSFHVTKTETFECNRLFVRTPSKSDRVTVYLDTSVSTEDMSGEALNILLTQEFT